MEYRFAKACWEEIEITGFANSVETVGEWFLVFTIAIF